MTDIAAPKRSVLSVVSRRRCTFSKFNPLHPGARMNAQIKKSLKKKRGQGMTEYIIIVALIAIAAIGVITLFGDNIRRLFGKSANALAGSSSIANDLGKSTTAIEKKQMKSFGQNNVY
jgi:Flp pilus assembly pilin Flp